MEYLRLGRSEFHISRVGFGGWAIGAYGSSGVTDESSIRAIHRALDLGVNFFDTADVYGFGHSEQILYRALAERRKDLIIASKFGIRWNHGGQTTRDISRAWAVKALEASLKRLRLDCIPLWQIHWPDGRTRLSETMEVLLMAQRAGKICHIGCCNFSADQVREIQRFGRVESIQTSYNVVDRDVEENLFECCREFGMGVLAHSPLAQGLLTAKFDPLQQFATNDIRSRSKYFGAQNGERNRAVVNKLKELTACYQKSSAQVAIRWILDHPAITSAIAGAKNPAQIEDNAGAAGWQLRRCDRDSLSSVAEDY